ncbi:MAG: glycosyltransferase family 4 protein [Chitinophagaceae bacterium]
MLNVLFYTPWWPNNASMTGIFIKEHAIAIAKHCNLFVMHVHVEKSWRKPFFFIEKKETKELNYYLFEYTLYIPPVPKSHLFFKSKMKNLLQREVHILNEKYHFGIVHVNVMSEQAQWVCQTEQVSSLPHVLTEHNGFLLRDQNRLDQNHFDSFKNKYANWIEKANIQCIMPVSSYLEQVLKKEYEIKNNIKTIPNVINVSQRDISNRVSSQNKIRLCLLANWEYPKCPELFVKALKQIPKEWLAHIQITWAGFGSQYNKLQTDDIWNHVEVNFVGKLEKNEVYDMLNNQDILIHPTYSETFSVVVVEALTFGLAVLSTPTGIMPEYVNSSNGVLVQDFTIDSFIKGLEKILSNFKNGMYIRNVISDQVKDVFSTNTVGLQIFDVYTNVLENR